MTSLGLLVAVGACFGAWYVAQSVARGWAGFVLVGSVAAGYGLLVLLPWWVTGRSPSMVQIQLGLLCLYGLAYSLVPAAGVSLFVSPRWRGTSAFAVAGVLPLSGVLVYAGLGTDQNYVSEGMGHLSDLLFLNPALMGEGVTRSGFIPHRYQIHYVALAGIVLLALTLLFLPTRRSLALKAQDPDDSEGTTHDR